MSDIFFFDTGESPQPRERVEIVALEALPYPDGSRVHIRVQMTPFLERPNLEIYAQKEDGPIVAEMSVIETMQHILEFTLHIRGVDEVAGDYHLTAELFYDDRQQPQHRQEIDFSVESVT